MRIEGVEARRIEIELVAQHDDQGSQFSDVSPSCAGRRWSSHRHKVAKHFELSIGEAALGWSRRQDAIDAEAALDGLYVIRTSVDAQRMDAPSCLRSYKPLSNLERAFRSLKTVDLKVRPIHHRLADRVRAHILLCMLGVRNTCRTPSADADAPTFELLTTASPHQQRALALIQAIQP
jgi:hypothetical protein